MWYAIVAILILIADQGLKYWVTLNIPLDTGHVTLIPGVLELTNIHNNGAAFSILQHAPHWLFVIFTVVFAAIAVFCLRRNIVHGKVGRWSVVLVLAGAVGNCIDRILSGYVVDMFNFLFMRFAVFNLADIFIVVAGITLCLHVIFYRGDGSEGGRARAEEGAQVPSAAPGAPARAHKLHLPARKQQPAAPKKPAAQPVSPAPAKDDPFAAWDRAPVQAQPVTPAAPSAPKKGPGSACRPQTGAGNAQGGCPRRQTGGHSPGRPPARLSQQHARRAGRTGSRGQRQGKRHRPGGRRALFARRHFSGVFGFLMEQRTIQTQESAERIDALLARSLPELTRSAAQRLLAQGAVTKDGAPVKKNYKTAPGDTFVVTLPDAAPSELVAQDLPLDVVYEDDDLIVVNKPRGMVVHPAPGHEDGTLVNALLAHCGDSLSGVGGERRPGIVHRIDKDTSGLLVAAKNDFAHLALSAQLADHTMARTYEAVVCGNLREDAGTVDAPIGRHPTDRKRMAVTQKNARRAVTHWSVIARYNGYTHIRCELETGRTHQIRVHMAHIGHPLLGDLVYGHKRPEKGLSGQCLHARALRFLHPRTGELVTFTCPLPDYFQDVLARLGPPVG